MSTFISSYTCMCVCVYVCMGVQVNAVQDAIQGMKDGTVDPSSVKIEGIETPEEVPTCTDTHTHTHTRSVCSFLCVPCACSVLCTRSTGLRVHLCLCVFVYECAHVAPLNAHKTRAHVCMCACVRVCRKHGRPASARRASAKYARRKRRGSESKRQKKKRGGGAGPSISETCTHTSVMRPTKTAQKAQVTCACVHVCK